MNAKILACCLVALAGCKTDAHLASETDAGADGAAVAEICGNGLDDDADGVIDEGCGADAGVPDGSACVAVEICNEQDDDCDGLIDEGFTLYCDRDNGVSSPSLCTDPGDRCDGIDNNCNGEIDEGCPACEASTEICNEVDDDCDGLIDEGFTLYCDRDHGVTERTLCADPGDRCDGIDNNCNGEVDEGCPPCEASTEVCNGFDDDCDGLIDEGFTLYCNLAHDVTERILCDDPGDGCDGTDSDCDGEIDEDC